MNQNIFFILLNVIVETVTIVAFYSVFIAKSAGNLNHALKTRPILTKAVICTNSRSYLRSYIYFSIALAAYVVIAIGNDVEVDMDLAMTSLVILFAITLARIWFLRRLLGKP